MFDGKEPEPHRIDAPVRVLDCAACGATHVEASSTDGLCPACEAGTTPSPCTGECELDGSQRTCTSCLRLIDEIVRWSALAPRERRATYRRIAALRGSRVAR